MISSGVPRQRAQHRLVGLVERAAVLPVGHVERAAHLARGEDRHAEQRLHMRMLRRESERARVPRHVVELHRQPVLPHRAERTVPLRRRLQRVERRIVHTAHDEPLDVVVRPRDRQRSVRPARHLARHVDDVLQLVERRPRRVRAPLRCQPSKRVGLDVGARPGCCRSCGFGIDDCRRRRCRGACRAHVHRLARPARPRDFRAGHSAHGASAMLSAR